MSEEIPQWAKQRVLKLAGVSSTADTDWGRKFPSAFARYIAEHEKPPVDPLLIEAEALASGHHVWDSRDDFRAAKSLALAALKRGIEIEIGKGQA